MRTVLGLFAIALFIVGVIALAGSVTYLVVRLTPTRKPDEPTESA